MEVYLDSGIRRGTDILKCLCLGATAVGMGRHFLYAANYGPEGVEKLIESKQPTPFPFNLPDSYSVPLLYFEAIGKFSRLGTGLEEFFKLIWIAFRSYEGRA